jgi:hypothetical protein
MFSSPNLETVIPAQAGIHAEAPQSQTVQFLMLSMGPRFHGDDVRTLLATFY